MGPGVFSAEDSGPQSSWVRAVGTVQRTPISELGEQRIWARDGHLRYSRSLHHFTALGVRCVSHRSCFQLHGAPMKATRGRVRTPKASSKEAVILLIFILPVLKSIM